MLNNIFSWLGDKECEICGEHNVHHKEHSQNSNKVHRDMDKNDSHNAKKIKTVFCKRRSCDKDGG